jgi:hypothetical protein
VDAVSTAALNVVTKTQWRRADTESKPGGQEQCKSDTVRKTAPLQTGKWEVRIRPILNAYLCSDDTNFT